MVLIIMAILRMENIFMHLLLQAIKIKDYYCLGAAEQVLQPPGRVIILEEKLPSFSTKFKEAPTTILKRIANTLLDKREIA